MRYNEKNNAIRLTTPKEIRTLMEKHARMIFGKSASQVLKLLKQGKLKSSIASNYIEMLDSMLKHAKTDSNLRKNLN